MIEKLLTLYKLTIRKPYLELLFQRMLNNGIKITKRLLTIFNNYNEFFLRGFIEKKIKGEIKFEYTDHCIRFN